MTGFLENGRIKVSDSAECEVARLLTLKETHRLASNRLDLQ